MSFRKLIGIRDTLRASERMGSWGRLKQDDFEIRVLRVGENRGRNEISLLLIPAENWLIQNKRAFLKKLQDNQIIQRQKKNEDRPVEAERRPRVRTEDK